MVKINLAVIKLTNLFTGQNVKTIKDAKMIIKEDFMKGSLDYTDYEDNSFDLCNILYMEKNSGDFHKFSNVFFMSTMLVVPLLKVDENDEMMCNKMSEIISKLYDDF